MPSLCWPCTGAAGKPTRWPPTGGPATCSPASWASTPGSRCSACTPPSWPTTRRWSGPAPRTPPPAPSALRPADSGGGPALGRRRARRLLAAGSALAVAAAVSIGVAARPWAGEAPAQLPANSVGLIDPAGGRVGDPVMVGSPVGLAYGDGSVWAVDSTDNTLFRINPATHAVTGPIPVGAGPAAVTVTPGGNVW